MSLECDRISHLPLYQSLGKGKSQRLRAPDPKVEDHGDGVLEDFATRFDEGVDGLPSPVASPEEERMSLI